MSDDLSNVPQPKPLGGGSEVSLYGFGGLSSFNVKKTDFSWKITPSINTGIGINYTHFFTHQWAFLIGLEYSHRKSNLKIQNETESFDRVSLATLNASYTQVNTKVSHHFDTYSEDVSVNYFSVPLMLQFVPHKYIDRHSFYIGAGVTPSFIIDSKSQARVDGGSTVTDVNGTPLDIAEAGTFNITNNAKGSPAKVNVFLNLETGIRWKLSGRNALYTGIYADYGLLPLDQTNSENGLYHNYWLNKSTGAPLTGLLSSNHIDNVKQWGAGVKVRLAIGVGKEIYAEDSSEPRPFLNALGHGISNSRTSVRISARATDDNTMLNATYTVATVDGTPVQTMAAGNGECMFRFVKKKPHVATLSIDLPPTTDLNLISVDEPILAPNILSTGVGAGVVAYFRDAQTGNFLQGSARVFDMSSKQHLLAILDVQGGVSMVVPSGSFYRIVFEVQARKIKTPFTKIKKGAKVTFSKMEFTKKNKLTGKSQLKLNDMIAFLKAYPNVSIEVGNHTDNTHPGAINNKITTIRARAIVAYMEQQGVERERLKAKGYGATRPTASNNTAKGRERNQRTEITITSTTYDAYDISKVSSGKKR
ncbi:hypothetical protein AGMMS4956_06750 [Bacteroidia bacterium]|nr:hypothetical protein AGMMS4956_06750 [Bacteroidia bacterium]